MERIFVEWDSIAALDKKDEPEDDEEKKKAK